MLVVIDHTAVDPPYEQIRAQIAAQARSGGLPAGTRLPTVRHLAADLGLAPGTVARAYKELESDRVIETRGRHGTFVSVAPDEVTREAFAAAFEYAARVHRLGLGLNAAVTHLSAAFNALGSNNPPPETAGGHRDA
jgi:DNA-binding transcriptional regulator YhcF (GntR family)